MRINLENEAEKARKIAEQADEEQPLLANTKAKQVNIVSEDIAGGDDQGHDKAVSHKSNIRDEDS